MMDGGMSSMMGWMMGIGLLGWVLVIGLLATIVVLLFRLVERRDQDREASGSDTSTGRSQSS
jgi:uncharacterized membrane protein